MDKTNKTVTLSLDSVVELILGHEKRGARSLPDYETSLIINQLVKDETLFKVQFEEFDGTPLTYPIFWSYQEWYNSSQRYKSAKHRSELERIARRIFDVNVKIVTKFLINEMFMEEEKARTTAYNLLAAKKFGVIRAMGIKHLVTKAEELK